MRRHPKFLTWGAFQVRIEMKRHNARGPMSLPLDLPDIGQRLGTLTPCLRILGVWPFHYTAEDRTSEALRAPDDLEAPRALLLLPAGPRAPPAGGGGPLVPAVPVAAALVAP